MIRALLTPLLLGAAVLGGVLGTLAGVLRDQLSFIEFAQPLWLLAAVLPVLGLVARAVIEPRPPSVRLARAQALRGLGPGLAGRIAPLPDAMRVAAGVLLAVALARPQSARLDDRVEHEGIDIAMVLDMSESMEIGDLAPNRLEAAKLVLDDFIRRRPRDRIALVAYGSSASTVSPLTLDHDVLRALVRRMRLGVIDGSRTAIGAGLGVSATAAFSAAISTTSPVPITPYACSICRSARRRIASGVRALSGVSSR